MLASRLDPYVGLAYEADAFDCADLAILLQADLFGRTIVLPGRRQRAGAPVATANRYRDALADRITREELRDGDVVLFLGDTLHLGTVFLLHGRAWVLHTTRERGYSLLQPLEDLGAYCMQAEGFYRWK